MAHRPVAIFKDLQSNIFERFLLFSIRELLSHENVTFNDNGTLSTIPHHPLEWRQELSGNRSEDDILYLPNIALLVSNSLRKFFLGIPPERRSQTRQLNNTTTLGPWSTWCMLRLREFPHRWVLPWDVSKFCFRHLALLSEACRSRKLSCKLINKFKAKRKKDCERDSRSWSAKGFANNWITREASLNRSRTQHHAISRKASKKEEIFRHLARRRSLSLHARRDESPIVCDGGQRSNSKMQNFLSHDPFSSSPASLACVVWTSA